MHRVLIIPAAGLGSRLRSSAPKVLTPVNGRPMVDHLLALFRPFVDRAAIIAHPGFAEQVRAHVSRQALPCEVLEQPSPTGMLDAILTAEPWVRAADPDHVWVVWCDQVALLPETLERLARAGQADPAPDLIMPTVRRQDPYIHFARDANGRIVAVRQRREGDQMPLEGESDIGLFSLSARAFGQLPAFAAVVEPGHGTAERNFLPFIPWLAARRPVTTIDCTDPREATGINTPEDLAGVEAWLSERTAAS